MIDRCFNPACQKRLRYLRDGRVVRVIQNHHGQLRVEHFWLCGPCYTSTISRFPKRVPRS